MPDEATQSQRLKINDSFGNLPLYFIRNEGQVDGKVEYYEKGSGHATYFTREGVYLSLITSPQSPAPNPQSPIPSPQPPKASESIRLSFVNANKNPEIIALDEQAGRVNYFKGNDPAKWRSNVPTFASVLYKEVWPGIDIKFYGNNQTLEYDVIVRPGADPNVVKFSYEGIEGLKVADNGDMEILLKEGKVVQKKPYVYQEIEGKRKEVEGSFAVSVFPGPQSPISSPQSPIPSPQSPVPNSQSPVPNSYSFEVASYDRTKDLVIDPVLVYSTFLGGSNSDYGHAIAVDSSGSAYVTGYTESSDFPTANPFDGTFNGSDAFVTKLNPSGTALVYSTYLGGTASDYGDGIAVDSFGNAYVTGYTNSSDFPMALASAYDTTCGGCATGYQDAFVSKLNATGSALVYSTYLGGSDNDRGLGIAVDSSGNAYVTGDTYSSDFPIASPLDGTYNGGGDAFVAKLNAAGSALMYSTFLGGSINDSGYAIAVDSSGKAYVTGVTYSSDFPIANPFDGTYNGYEIYYDAFVTKLDASGSALVYSTFLGGNNFDLGYAIALDSSGSAYVTGVTYSSDFPIASPLDGTWNGGYDAFVTKLNAAGSALVYSTFLGGNGSDEGHAIAVDSSGNAYVTGSTASSNFPTASPIDWTLGGANDAFVTKLNASGSALSYSTFLGGGSYDSGIAIAVDSSGNAYVTGRTWSPDFPIASAFDGTFNGGYDAFVTEIFGDSLQYTLTVLKSGTGSGTVTSSPTGINCGSDCSEPYNPGTSVTLTETPASGSTFAGWSGACSGTASTCVLTMDANKSATATFTDSIPIEILTLSLSSGTVGSSYSQTLTATGGTTPYTWSIASGLPPGLSINGSTGIISGTPTTAGTYGFTAMVTDSSSSSDTQALSITISASGVDLIVSSLTAPSATTIGGTVSISATVTNQGVEASGRFFIAFFASTDTAITTSDIYLGYRPVWNGLGAGESVSAALLFNVPLTVSPGTYYIGAIADVTGIVAETSEANNTRASSAVTLASGADLIVPSISSSSSANAGASVPVTLSVKNNGSGKSGRFYSGLYMSTDTAITTSDIYLGYRPEWDGLSGGETNTSTGSFTIPLSVAPGTYYIGAIADVTGVVVETSEANNTATTSAITILAGVDLVVSALSAPPTGTAGSAVSVSSIVGNIGTVDSLKLFVEFYLSTNPTITTGDINIGYRPIWGGVPAGGSDSDTRNLLIPSRVAPGTYYLGAIADSTNINTESNEANNTNSDSIIITSP